MWQQGRPVHVVFAFASSSSECTAGEIDPRPGREVQSYREMQVVDMEAVWVPIMARYTPHGETPGPVWVALP